MNDSGGQDRRLSLALALVGVAALILVSVPSLAAFKPPCFFRAISGLYCPGCGTTRAVSAVLGGDLVTAARMNPLLLLLGPMLGYVLLRDSLGVLGVLQPPARSAGVWVPVALAVTVVLFWVLRNVPVWPFSLLAPG